MWPALERVGLVVHSDSTGPGAAPSISQTYLETLSRRAEEFVLQHCGVSSVIPVTLLPSTEPGLRRNELSRHGKQHGLSHTLVLLFSSQETSAPVTLGEETMMTQMSGKVVENRALAEVALLRLDDFELLFNLLSSATETLELLDAPIGENQPTPAESMDILRAQAGQQALDRSLFSLGQRCEGSATKN